MQDNLFTLTFQHAWQKTALAHWWVVAARLKDTERQVYLLLTATTCYSAEGNHLLVADTAR